MTGHSGTPISSYAKNILARIADAINEKLERDSSPSETRGYEVIGLRSKPNSFVIYVDKEVKAGVHNNSVNLVVSSNGIQEENACYGRAEAAIGDLKSDAIKYASSDIMPSFKSCVARELDRSGVPALVSLSAEFVAELKGERPEPPLSRRAQAALAKLDR